MCDCFKVGGPWISFDPECPAHGYEAQRREQEREDHAHKMEMQVQLLQSSMQKMSAAVTGDAALAPMVADLQRSVDALLALVKATPE